MGSPSLGEAHEDVDLDKTTSATWHRPWRTTYLRFGPLSGLCGMVLAIISLVISLGILVGSDGVPTSNWSAPPSTYLAICTAVANLAMRFAALHGVVVCWWVKAMKGSSIEQLHWNWRSGTTLQGAFTAGRHTGLMALACIFSTLVVIDGPFLQRASTVISAPIRDQALTLNVTMSPQVPRDSTGGWVVWSDRLADRWGYSFNKTIPTWNGNVSNSVQAQVTNEFDGTTAPGWFAETPLSGMVSECPGKCTAKIKAPAVSVTHCRSIVQPVNYTRPASRSDYVKWSNQGPPLYVFGFVIDTALVLNEKESINLVTGYSQTTGDDCVGTFRMKTCSLHSAIGEYDVTVDHDIVTLASEPPRIVAISNNTEVNHSVTDGWHPSTLSGVIQEVYSKFDGMVMVFGIDGGPSVYVEGSSFEAFNDYHPDQRCMSYRDPQEAMIREINNLMFRTGAAAARNSASYLEGRLDPGMMEHVNATTTAYLQGNHDVFHTDYVFFAIAAAVEMLCICFILPTYWGWWTIGRPVSFSPLEMAKAFESPLLSDSNSNSSGRDIARTIGHIQLQYGAIGQEGDEKKLAFASPEEVEAPRPSPGFGS